MLCKRSAHIQSTLHISRFTCFCFFSIKAQTWSLFIILALKSALCRADAVRYTVYTVLSQHISLNYVYQLSECRPSDSWADRRGAVWRPAVAVLLMEHEFTRERANVHTAHARRGVRMYDKTDEHTGARKHTRTHALTGRRRRLTAAATWEPLTSTTSLLPAPLPL